jgi:hypothetical protein
VPENAQLREAYQAANDSVRGAEERLAKAWAAFAAGNGGPPEKELLTAVAHQRRECDRCLSALLNFNGAGKPAANSPSILPGDA